MVCLWCGRLEYFFLQISIHLIQFRKCIFRLITNLNGAHILFMCVGLEKPKEKAMYMATNQTAEKWSKLAFTFLVVITPIAFCFPKAILVYWVHFATDSGNNAFELPFSMW